MTVVMWLSDISMWWVGVGAYAAVVLFEGLRATRKHPSLLVGLPLSLVLLHLSFSIGLVDGILRRGRIASDR